MGTERAVVLSDLVGRLGRLDRTGRLSRVGHRCRRAIGPVSQALGGSDPGRSRENRQRGIPAGLRTDLAVFGRAILFALATVAGAADPGSGSDGGTGASGRRLRENGPAVLVPLAWSFALAAHLGWLEDRTVLIAHLVMDIILASFAAASWSEMAEGVLRVWKVVLLVGLGTTLSGTAALLWRSDDSNGDGDDDDDSTANGRVLSFTVLSWMIVPAAGLAYTGARVEADEAPWVYYVGALCSALAVLAYASAPADSPAVGRKLSGLALANVGQTAGIVNAVYQY